jgi:hypothetical protein
MKSFTLSLFFLLLITSCVSTGIKEDSGNLNSSKSATIASKNDTPTVNSQYYFDSLKSIKEQNMASLSAIDFVNFRYSYILARDENKIDVPYELIKELNMAVKSKENQTALELCDKILERDYTNIEAHVIRNHLSKIEGKNVSFYEDFVAKFMNSIFTSGDGNTPQTAFHVFKIDEEYYVLNVLRLHLNKQSLIDSDGQYFDLLEAIDEKGKIHKIYFNITEHMQSIQHIIRNKNNKS